MKPVTAEPTPWLHRHLCPRPQRLTDLGRCRLQAGRFELSADPGPRLAAAVQRLNERLDVFRQALLREGIGAEQIPPVPLSLEVIEPAQLAPQLADDTSYRLRIDDAGVWIEAATSWGALAALETLAQFVQTMERLHGVQIDDAPRFPWRGVMLDPARRFLPIADLKRTVAAMAAVKLNVLHLHLTDDQGFRFPSTRWPRLTSDRAYDRAELAELVAFAADHGVRIVPELDVPGHVTHWLAAYPQLGLEATAPTRRFGVHRAALNPAEPLVFAVLDDLIDELLALFPDQYLHLGGDEVHGEAWVGQPPLDAFMAAHGFADQHDLQGWFTEQLARSVLARGRRPVVWDEALHDRLKPLGEDLLVQCWRGSTARDRALAAGHCCLVSAGYYLDLNYPARWHYDYDPLAPEAELLMHEDRLLTEPAFADVAEGMRWTHQWRQSAGAAEPEPLAGRVLGGEACLWGELVNAETLDRRLWSRLPAIAELLWSPPELLDADSLNERLLLQHAYLEDAGLLSLTEPLEQRLETLGIGRDWWWLAAWLEPVKWYGRLLGAEALAARLAGEEMPQARPYGIDSPLDELVDQLLPESLATEQQFRALLGPDLAKTGLRYLLLQWRELLAAPHCPPLLLPHAERLTVLATLLEREIAGSDPVTAAELAPLLPAIDDILLAPAVAMKAFVDTRSESRGGP